MPKLAALHRLSAIVLFIVIVWMILAAVSLL